MFMYIDFILGIFHGLFIYLIIKHQCYYYLFKFCTFRLQCFLYICQFLYGLFVFLSKKNMYVDTHISTMGCVQPSSLVWSVTLFKCNWYIICKLTFWVASDLNKIPNADNWDYSFWYTIPLGKFMFPTQMSWPEVYHIQIAMSSRRSWSFGDPERWDINSRIDRADNTSGWLSCRYTSEDHSRPHQKWI